VLLNPDVIKETANEVLNNLKAARYRKAVIIGKKLPSAKIAFILLSVSPEVSAQFLKITDKKKASRIIASMPPEFSVEVLMCMAEDERIALINSVPADNIDDIFEQMAEEVKSRIILKLDKKLKVHAEKTKKYPRESAGRRQVQPPPQRRQAVKGPTNKPLTFGCSNQMSRAEQAKDSFFWTDVLCLE